MVQAAASWAVVSVTVASTACLPKDGEGGGAPPSAMVARRGRSRRCGVVERRREHRGGGVLGTGTEKEVKEVAGAELHVDCDGARQGGVLRANAAAGDVVYDEGGLGA